MRRLHSALTVLLALALPGVVPQWAVADAASGPTSLLELQIGDPARKNRQASLVLDAITDTATGQVITPPELARSLRSTGILFIGENHTNADFHEVQLRTIRALHESGREVLIGLEMLPYTEQSVLDDWTAGRLTEAQFLEASRWYENWSHHWNYYRDILGYARDNQLRLYAINSPREVVRRVRADGFAALSLEEAAHFPPSLAPESDEHRLMYRASFPADDKLHLNEAALSGLYRAQTAWDATLGWNALEALRNHGGTKAIMVVLLGAGHASYGLGSERQIDAYYDGRIASLLPVPVVDGNNRTVSQVRASYASFLWGVPQVREPLYPVIGVSLMGRFGDDPGQIIQVNPGSIADRAGLNVGDVLTSFNGRPISTDTGLRQLTADLRWGDDVRLGVRRSGKLLELTVPVRRTLPNTIAPNTVAPNSVGPCRAEAAGPDN